MAWRLAKSLETLRTQVNSKWPNRDKSSDGTIGDAAHQATNSDHNPNSAGVVTAMDITHDPAHGLDARKLAEALVASRDSRIKYIISNGQIISSVVSPWQWRTYSGSNAHRHHVHISVMGSAGLYDDARQWKLDGEPAPKVAGRQYGIVATYFGGSSDPNTSAYDGHLITDSEYGVALPYRFKGERPKVRVFKDGKSVVCNIVDVGPWNINDPYWETGARPQAESGTDTTGRTTNKAGIDVTPAVNRLLGLNGKGVVDWEFDRGEPVPEPIEKPKTIEEAIARVEAQLAATQSALTELKEQIRMSQPTQPQFDLAALLQSPVVKELLGKLLPVLLPYIIQLLPQLLPLLLKGFGQQKPAVSGTAVATGSAIGVGGGLIGALITAFLKGGG